MNKVIVFEYDGCDFYGSQRQSGLRTVQETVESLLEFMFKKKIEISLASRTDRYVHARHQVAMFDCPVEIENTKLIYALNRMIDRDIKFKYAYDAAEEFHPRFSNSIKTYRYKITYVDDIFTRRYSYYRKNKLDVIKVRGAIKYIVGEHDFFAFSCRRKDETTTVRTIYSIDLEESDCGLDIVFRGNGFLYKMVRIIVAYLIKIGESSIKPEFTVEVFKDKTKKYTKDVAPGCGLILEKIEY